MKIFGLTGGIASGKSTVAEILKKANIPVIDADQLAHQITQNDHHVLNDIKKIFSNKVINPNGTLNRKELAKIVFGNREKLHQLENIIHPKIKILTKKIVSELEKKGHEIIVYMAPLIFEKKLEKEYTKTILIVTEQDNAIKRIQERDNISFAQAKDRIDCQMSNQKKITLADEIIYNNGTKDELKEKLEIVWKKLTNKSL